MLACFGGSGGTKSGNFGNETGAGNVNYTGLIGDIYRAGRQTEAVISRRAQQNNLRRAVFIDVAGH